MGINSRKVIRESRAEERRKNDRVLWAAPLTGASILLLSAAYQGSRIDIVNGVRAVVIEELFSKPYVLFSSQYAISSKREDSVVASSGVSCGDNYINPFVNFRPRDAPMYHRQEARHYARRRDCVSNVRKRI